MIEVWQNLSNEIKAAIVGAVIALIIPIVFSIIDWVKNRLFYCKTKKRIKKYVNPVLDLCKDNDTDLNDTQIAKAIGAAINSIDYMLKHELLYYPDSILKCKLFKYSENTRAALKRADDITKQYTFKDPTQTRAQISQDSFEDNEKRKQIIFNLSNICNRKDPHN